MRLHLAETLLFLHLPKTGGVSLSTALAERFPKRVVFHVVGRVGRPPTLSPHQGTIADFRELSETDRARFRCVIGHFHLAEALHEVIPGPARYLTVLRDPIERIASQLGQFNRMVAAGEMPSVDRPVGLSRFSELRPQSVANHQTRFLCGGGYASRSETENLARAKENLRERFSVVGTTERFEETIRAVGATYGWASFRVRRLNSANEGGGVSFSPSERSWLHRLNRMDTELHAFAGQLLDERLAALEATGRFGQGPASPRGLDRALRRLRATASAVRHRARR
jgi:hypothetical protein